METKKNCKVKGNYPKGNLTLSNIKMACTESNYSNTSPGWIGVVHEVNKTEDQGYACLIINLIGLLSLFKRWYEIVT